MATVSPTPMAGETMRRTSQRQLRRPLPTRSAANRAEAQSSSRIAAPQATKPHQRQQQQQREHDSSEDEMPVPMKLSALTTALLNDGGPVQAAQEAGSRLPSPPRTRRQASAVNASAQPVAATAATRRSTRTTATGPTHASEVKSRSNSPNLDLSPARKRVVRLSSNTPQGLSQMSSAHRRSTSTAASAQQPQPRSRPHSRQGSVDRSVDGHQESHANVNTPAQAARVVRIASGSSASRSRVASGAPSSGRSHLERSVLEKSALEPDHEQSEIPDTAARNAANANIGSISRIPSTCAKADDNANPQSSMRVKRAGKLSGSFLSGPARRGRHRQSEEEAYGHRDGENAVQEPASQRRDDQAEVGRLADDIRGFNSGSPVGGSAARIGHRRNPSGLEIRADSAKTSPQQVDDKKKQEPDESKIGDIGHLVSVGRLQMPSSNDQENEIPLNRKWAKPTVIDDLDKSRRPLVAQVRAVSPERKPLSSIANNTPHRPAPPPPPKMSSVLDAATSATGAATTTQSKQRRNILKVNGKCYTRHDCLGRGGSGKVYRVTAENGHMFALKRVALENVDDQTIKFFQAEIDLLEKLSDVERVVNLFAHEMNEEKQMLSMVMEMGERDLNTVITAHQSREAAKLDTVFIRFYWKEMLECVQAVHQHSIVHSDLKPANFVLVKGRLKLIDFGIAGAIPSDETVNVHRETQVGTPNYMSPESLMDWNSPRGIRLPGVPKLMKMGKPSDVWSLGCILYQMVYGVPPFGRIPNAMARCHAIINWDHHIDFPARGLGGSSIPPSLMHTMKRCLTREQHLRPTCEELLHATDSFLYPAEFSDQTLPINEELLKRMISSVIARCRERVPTEAEASTIWPQAYWASIKKQLAAKM